MHSARFLPGWPACRLTAYGASMPFVDFRFISKIVNSAFVFDFRHVVSWLYFAPLIGTVPLS
jgi:hypothetical protein